MPGTTSTTLAALTAVLAVADAVAAYDYMIYDFYSFVLTVERSIQISKKGKVVKCDEKNFFLNCRDMIWKILNDNNSVIMCIRRNLKS